MVVRNALNICLIQIELSLYKIERDQYNSIFLIHNSENVILLKMPKIFVVQHLN